MFGSCCVVCDPPSGKAGEAPAGVGDVPVLPGGHQAVLGPGGGEPMMALKTVGDDDAAGKADGSTRSESSQTSEQKAEDKARLQQLVKQFARDSLRGVPCKFVDLSKREVTSAVYKLDGNLNWISFQSGNGSSTFAVISVGQIEHVNRWEEVLDIDKSFMEEPLKQEDRNCVLQVRATVATQMNGQPSDTAATVVMEDDMQKERFITCLKILRLYCQTNTPTSEAAMDT